MLTPHSIVIVPGWRNCGEGYWQSLWAAHLAGAVRLKPDDWAVPTRTAWVRALSRAIQAQPHPVVVLAHSLGCIATAYFPANVAARIKGALFVAPVDPERRAVPSDFVPVPCERLPYRHVVIAGSNAPFCPPRLAAAYARAWVVNLCASRRWATSPFNRAVANGRWVWRCCSPCQAACLLRLCSAWHRDNHAY